MKKTGQALRNAMFEKFGKLDKFEKILIVLERFEKIEYDQKQKALARDLGLNLFSVLLLMGLIDILFNRCTAQLEKFPSNDSWHFFGKNSDSFYINFDHIAIKNMYKATLYQIYSGVF